MANGQNSLLAPLSSGEGLGVRVLAVTDGLALNPPLALVSRLSPLVSPPQLFHQGRN